MAGCATCLHKNVHPNVCEDCLGGTHYKSKIKTNADRIRSMTDEELAEFFAPRGCPWVILEETCPESGTTCNKCWLNWLKQESKE